MKFPKVSVKNHCIFGDNNRCPSCLSKEIIRDVNVGIQRQIRIVLESYMRSKCNEETRAEIEARLVNLTHHLKNKPDIVVKIAQNELMVDFYEQGTGNRYDFDKHEEEI